MDRYERTVDGIRRKARVAARAGLPCNPPYARADYRHSYESAYRYEVDRIRRGAHRCDQCGTEYTAETLCRCGLRDGL